MESFIEALDEHLSGLFDVPYALFGYSIGALQAFEWARYIRRRGRPAPRYLIVGARSAPQAPRRLPPLTGLPTPQFLRELQSRYGALDRLILDDPELLTITTQIMRDDMSIFDTYQYRADPALECPILALGGSTDAAVLRHELELWSTQTSSTFEARWFVGGHFFIRERPDDLIRLVSDVLQPLLAEEWSGDVDRGPAQPVVGSK